MSILAFLIGTGLSTGIGWLILGLAEGKTPVLHHRERLAYAVALGPTVAMFLVFLCNIAGLTRLNLAGFLLPQLIAIAVMGLITWKRSMLRLHSIQPFVSARSHSQWMTIGVGVLCIWTALKILAGAYDLVSVPTYWDDSFNNWNMRGKIFYVTQELKLQIPAGNGVATAEEGVSSYPPMVSLFKTEMAVLRGEWNDGLVNAVHLVWFLGLLGALYCTLRRSFDPLVSRLGIWAFVALPLVIIHGSNPYADMTVASHVFITMSCLLGLRRADAGSAVTAWTKLFFLSLGLLVFTKNESLVLHVPLLLLAAVSFDIGRKDLVASVDHRRTILVGMILTAAFVLPWLLFKWSHGLTFGNAKSVSATTFSFNPAVLNAIWIHLTHEPNWLLMPLTLPLVLFAAGRRFWRSPEAIVGALVLAEIGVQLLLFLFVPSLGTEAVHQTGLSRGLLQVMPTVILLLGFLGASICGSENRMGHNVDT